MGSPDGPGTQTQGRYLPALRFHQLTGSYDPVLKWGMREHSLKTALIQQARIEAGMWFSTWDAVPER